MKVALRRSSFSVTAPLKRYAPFTIIALVGLLAVGGGAFLYRSLRPQAVVVSEKSGEKGNDPSEAEHSLGPAKAAVTLEEFGDFQCPPCGALAGTLQQIEHDYSGRLRMIFREYPLAMHQHAREAALAAEAAGLQGRFWEMHALLFREQAVWSKAGLVTPIFADYAARLHLDVVRFSEDVRGEKTKARVAADQARAAKMGVTLTPTVFINGKMVESTSLNPAGLRSAIDAALKPKPVP